MKPPIGRDTRLCMSLSGRPGNAGSRFHNCLYEILGLDYVYKSFSTQDLAAAIGGIRALNVRGCAISMPFKEAVIPLIDDLESSARAIDSVNTIVNDDGRLTGYNTDYVAVRQLLEKRIEKPVPFLLRGSGGMAKAVAAALRDAGFANGTIIARNEMAGQAIADQYGFCWQADLPSDSAPLLINVTPLGMEGKDRDALAFRAEQIAACSTAFDVVAQPVDTPFVRAARAARKSVISGGEVIVLQAVEQFILYTGVSLVGTQSGESRAEPGGGAPASAGERRGPWRGRAGAAGAERPEPSFHGTRRATRHAPFTGGRKSVEVLFKKRD